MRIGTKLPKYKRMIQVREDVVKISPNEPCPCGSGIKYKRCCRSAGGVLGWWRRRRAMAAKRRQRGQEPGG